MTDPNAVIALGGDSLSQKGICLWQSLRSWVIWSFNAKSSTEAKLRRGRPAARGSLNYQDNFITPDDAVACLAQRTTEPPPNVDRRVVPQIVVHE
ncbi:hypothetical protein RvY_03537 [Ramazzottius varieornatus]|uniref:Uncharacterized protein n=1 Tax=Ramazzottius varieornatus TaxID=947166 RepID=A0A1D1UP76_RAMVA|nr:hypothetical protein RvY_03537 [Ramazzottius varieornatus]